MICIVLKRVNAHTPSSLFAWEKMKYDAPRESCRFSWCELWL